MEFDRRSFVFNKIIPDIHKASCLSIVVDYVRHDAIKNISIADFDSFPDVFFDNLLDDRFDVNHFLLVAIIENRFRTPPITKIVLEFENIVPNRLIEEPSVRALNYLATCDLKRLFTSSAEKNTEKELKDFTTDYLSIHFEKIYDSLSVLNGL